MRRRMSATLRRLAVWWLACATCAGLGAACGGAGAADQDHTVVVAQHDDGRREEPHDGARMSGLMGTISADGVRDTLQMRQDRFLSCFTHRLDDVSVLGGTADKAVLLSKKALLRPLGQPSPDAEVADLERKALSRINKLGIGPQALGGSTTALAVHAEVFPTHIASLPVAVNLQCHSARRKEAVL